MLLFIQLQVTEKTLRPLSAAAIEMGNLSPYLSPVCTHRIFSSAVEIQSLSSLSPLLLLHLRKSECQNLLSCPAKQPLPAACHPWLDQRAGVISTSFLLCCGCSSSHDACSRQPTLQGAISSLMRGSYQLSGSFSVEQISTSEQDRHTCARGCLQFLRQIDI